MKKQTSMTVKLILVAATAFGLLGCVNAPQEMTYPSVSSDKNERIFSGNYSSPFWQSDKFKGSHNRTLTNSHLTFELDEITGGVDTAVAGPDRPGVKVSEVHPDLAVCMSHKVVSDGFWWLGPKISVNWQSMVDKDKPASERGIWYENYIIDNASISPQEVEQWAYDIHNGKYVGDTVHDGATYKHYIIHFKTWVQYWAVRQEFREQGVTTIKPILDKWLSLGMEDREFDGVKLNIEFHGPAKAKVDINGHIPKDYRLAPNPQQLSRCAG